MARIRRPAAKKATTRALRRDQLELARKYIAEHCWSTPALPRAARTRLSVDEVANAIGISRRQLQRVFTEGGTTFTDEMHKALIERAERILLAGTMPVRDIASQAGYRHAGHFAKIFKRHRGARPDRLRRRKLGRHARRIGGLRGTALFEGRLSPRAVRLRELAAQHELTQIETRLSREIADAAEPETDNLALGLPWAVVIASILESQAGRLLSDVEALDRRAWRERGSLGHGRRAQLQKDIRDLAQRISDFRTSQTPSDSRSQPRGP